MCGSRVYRHARRADRQPSQGTSDGTHMIRNLLFQPALIRRHLGNVAHSFLTRVVVRSTVVAMLPFMAEHGEAQVTHRIPSSVPSCPTCRITVERLSLMGTFDGPGAFASRPYTVSVDSRGRYYVTTPETRDKPPFVFDARGRFLQRLGRRGDGPGEYREPQVIIVAPGDTLHILDRTTNRYTVLSPDYAVARTANLLPDMWSAVRMPDGHLIVNARVRDAPRIGLPFHVVDPQGQYLRSFGDANPIYDFRNAGFPNIRWLAASDSGTFWAAPYVEWYTVERWTTSGAKMTEIIRSPEWYEPYDQFWLPRPDRAPAPTIRGIWEGDGGLLWVVLAVQDINWRDGLGPVRTVEGQTVTPVVDEQRVYDGVIEVIDPIRGELVASRRFPGTFDIVVKPGIVVGVRRAESGWHYLEVWQVQLQR